METIKDVGSAFLCGFYDGFKGFFVAYNLDDDFHQRRSRISPAHSNSPIRRKYLELKEQTPVKKTPKQKDTVKYNIQQCLFLGMLFLLSLIFYNYVFLPTLRFFIVKIFGEFNSDINSVWSTIESILYFLFQSVWIVPFFAVSKIINNLYFQNIGQTAYKYSRGRPSVSLSLSKTIADFIFSSVVEILFLIQADVITYIHFYHMQHVLYSVHLSLLYSLYAFEYKWIEMGWEIDRRLTYIEIHWIYFIGYGLPLALTTQVFNYWIIKACIFSILFPFYIVGANEATPKMVEFCAHIKFFSPVVTISNSIFSVLRRNNKLSGQRNLTQPRR